jgi:glycosyltransferase involved in cell wall biosynthesis
MQFHLLSFEGPDAYARAGGLASRVEGLAQTLAALGHEAHLWFVGDPYAPGHEVHDTLHLHRWSQWISAYHPGGVYDGEFGKWRDFSTSLPDFLLREWLAPALASGERAVVLAEEWHTAEAVQHLDARLREAGLRRRVGILWNANNVFGFDRIDWAALQRAAALTTVSRYMKHRLREWGVDAVVIPNGLAADAFESPDRQAVSELRGRFRGRTLLAKMARFDPDKRWLGTMALVAELKARALRPLLVARGGSEPHGAEVLATARRLGLRVVERPVPSPGAAGLLDALDGVRAADVVHLTSYVDPAGRRALFSAADAVLANSEHEPFGLVGLEAMAVGGVACTGSSGEDYAVPGHNALVLERGDADEFLGLYQRLRAQPREARALRRAARQTARHYAWPQVVRQALLPRAALAGRHG